MTLSGVNPTGSGLSPASGPRKLPFLQADVPAPSCRSQAACFSLCCLPQLPLRHFLHTAACWNPRQCFPPAWPPAPPGLHAEPPAGDAVPFPSLRASSSLLLEGLLGPYRPQRCFPSVPLVPCDCLPHFLPLPDSMVSSLPPQCLRRSVAFSTKVC